MISAAFINGSYDYLRTTEINEFNKDIDISFQEACNQLNSFMALHAQYTTESDIMGDMPEEYKVVLEAEKRNLVSKVGETVIAIYNKFIELLEGFMDKLRSISFAKKSDIGKMEVLVKQHPDLKDKIICSFQKGELELNDIKTLKELDDAFEDILKLSKKANIKPGSMRDKWEKTKDKIDKIDKSKAVKIASATTGVITASVAVATFSQRVLSSKKNMNEDKQKMGQMKEKFLATIKELENDPDIPVDEKTGKCQTLLTAWRYVSSKHAAARNEELSHIEKLENSIAKFVDNFTNTNRFQKDVNYASQKVRNDQYDELQKKVREASEIARAQQLARDSVKNK